LPFRDHLSHLRDIDSSIDLIQSFIGAKDFDAFRDDRKTVAAVERMLQIISEAAIR
jgi:uncharacterized protein with HEPN domain